VRWKVASFRRRWLVNASTKAMVNGSTTNTALGGRICDTPAHLWPTKSPTPACDVALTPFHPPHIMICSPFETCRADALDERVLENKEK
jgi:hypothetical protein